MDERTIVPILSNFRHFSMLLQFILKTGHRVLHANFSPPVNFCSDKNIQTIFGTKLEDFLNYRIDYNLISQTVEKVVKEIFFRTEIDAIFIFFNGQASFDFTFRFYVKF
jgi:hypothetical protein